MPVDTEKADYKAYFDIWAKCRAVVEGQEAIHAEGHTFLPGLSGQDNDDYNSYLTRTMFYGATQRTVDAMTGLLFRKTPVFNYPDSVNAWMNDIDLNGNSIFAFAEELAGELLKVGRFGLLVEHPENVIETGQITQAEAENNNIRPFFAAYTAENIINWKVITINNQKFLSMVVLREYSEKSVDEFEIEADLQYRVLDLDEEGAYRQRVYVANEKDEFYLQRTIYPLQNGQKMRFIPFIILGAKGINADIVKPPILDLVNVNLSHYRTTADLEHGAHYTGLPTAVITGHRIGENERLRIGSATAWVFAEPEADAKYLEFTGQGLAALEKRLEHKENQMAALGARMLASEKREAETAETHIIKRVGENSALASIAQCMDMGITKALNIMFEWGGVAGEFYFEINKDFIPSKMAGADLLALFTVYQGGGMGFSDFIENLQKGEIIDPEKTPEQIREEIDNSGGGLGAFNADA